MPNTRIASALSLIFALAAPGCGPSTEPTTAAAPDDNAGFEEWEDTEGPEEEPRASAIETLGLTPPETPWADMNAHDREWYMVGKVLPIMAEVFRAHDASRFDELRCENCHGENMREVDFAMPSPSMYRLPRPGTPAHSAMLSSMGPMVEFMKTEVTPKMTAIMGFQATCASCHPTD